MYILKDMEFEWDEEKRQRNYAERGVDFALACRIFDGPVIESEDTRGDYGEQRWRALGEVDGEYFVIAYTWRNDTCRIISAWKVDEDGKERYAAILGRPA